MKRSVIFTTSRGARQILFWLELALICSGLILGPVAEGFQLQLQQTLNVRTLTNGRMVKVGMLTAGSTVDVPEQFKREDADHHVDIQASLNAWLDQSRYDSKKDDNSDFFFPVHVVRASPGSDASKLKLGTTYYMAVGFLAKRGRVLETTEPADVYSFDDATPYRTARPTNADSQLAGRAGTCPNGCANSPNSTATQAQAALDIAANHRGTSALNPRPVTRGSESAAPDGSFTPQGYPFFGGTNCSQFIDPQGNYGPEGQMILHEIERYPYLMSADNRLNEICHSYNSFSEAQKKNWLIWVFTSVIMQESGCNPTAQGDPRANPNGVPGGYTQMEMQRSLRLKKDLDVWHGRFCTNPAGMPQEDILDPETNIRCGFRHFYNHIALGNNIYARTTSNYWHALTSLPKDGERYLKAKRVISSYRGCR